MKRILLAFTLAGFGLAALLAQNGPGVPSFAVVPEPENHAVTVDRLMRYHDSGEYDSQIRQVVNAARVYLTERVAAAAKEERLAAVFDIDETSLSNWKNMAECGFCAYPTQLKLYPSATATAIVPTLELFNYAKNKGVAVFFVTGRQDHERVLTIANLTKEGYFGWADLYTQIDGNKDAASVVKPKNRKAIEAKGYQIILNIGDQASDLAGCCAERVFKLPNPFYLVQ